MNKLALTPSGAHTKTLSTMYWGLHLEMLETVLPVGPTWMNQIPSTVQNSIIPPPFTTTSQALTLMLHEHA